jgi:cytosine/adenosine deaminase-related metal-dependent hydrolase
MINAHTHLYSGLAPFGLPQPAARPSTFLEVLERFWWRLDRALDGDMLRASARYYIADALRHGTLALVDHHESPSLIEGSLDILADACEDLGMAAVLCYGVTERNGGRLEAERGLAECQRFLRDNRRPLVRGAVGLHASFTVSDDTIRAAAELCREMNAVLHLHVAEDGCDAEDARRRGHDGVVARLEALDALPRGSILAHGVHLTAAEVARVHARGCWLVQNPRSNEQNGVGYAQTLRCSPLVALGTDGFPSDMSAERAEGRRLSAAHGEEPGAIDARLKAGRALIEQFFGGEHTFEERARTLAPGVSAGIADAEWDAIREEAAHQAQRLAVAMRTLA